MLRFKDRVSHRSNPPHHEAKGSGSSASSATERPDLQDARAGSSESVASDVTIKSPAAMDPRSAAKVIGYQDLFEPHLRFQATTDEAVPPTPIRTSLPPTKDWSERDTPRAQTRQEVEAFERRPRSSLASMSLTTFLRFLLTKLSQTYPRVKTPTQQPMKPEMNKTDLTVL